MDRSQIKWRAIAYWKKNIEALEKMDWQQYTQELDRHHRLTFGHLLASHPEWPQIFGFDCPYCQYIDEHQNDFEWSTTPCEGCPLYQRYPDAEDEEARSRYSCCKAWETVHRAFTNPRLYAKSLVKQTMENMLHYIERNDDNWNWKEV